MVTLPDKGTFRKLPKDHGNISFRFSESPEFISVFIAKIPKFTKNGYFAQQRKHLENCQKTMAES